MHVDTSVSSSYWKCLVIKCKVGLPAVFRFCSSELIDADTTLCNVQSEMITSAHSNEEVSLLSIENRLEFDYIEFQNQKQSS